MDTIMRLRGRYGRPILRVFAAILGVAALLVLGRGVGLLDEPPSVQSPAGIKAHLLDIDAPVTRLRAYYNYSVIAGGAFTGPELRRAMERDAVAAQHYSDVEPSTMRPEILKADRMAYVSYRLGERVYWTSRKVRIRGGETILTNGQTQIRARCGNCISMEPQMPTSADEPDPMQLDALTDTGHPMLLEPSTVTGHLLVSWPLDPFGPLTTGEPVGVETGPQLGGPLVPFWVAAFPFAPIADQQTDPELDSDWEPKGSVPEDFSPVLGPGVSTTPPGSVFPPLVGGTVPGFPLDQPPMLDQLQSLLDDPFAVELRDSLVDLPATSLAPLTPPINATPVPEPATFVLLGSGIAGLIARRWRLNKT